MARPLRLEFAGTLYHVTAGGNERRSIFLGDADGDRAAFLDVLGVTCERFYWLVHAYCLMTNHYHLMLETPDANLSKALSGDVGEAPAPEFLETGGVLRTFAEERTAAVGG